VAELETPKLADAEIQEVEYRLVERHEIQVELLQEQQNDDAKSVPDLKTLVEQHFGIPRPVRTPQGATCLESIGTELLCQVVRRGRTRAQVQLGPRVGIPADAVGT